MYFQNYKQLVVSNCGIETLDLNFFFIPTNFIRIKVKYSAISIGSESTTLDSRTILKTYRRNDFFYKIYEKLRNKRLFFTLKKLLTTKASLGYSLVGEVVGVGEGVTMFCNGDIVVATGEFATHATYVDVPQGFVFLAPSTEANYAFCSLAAIAINGARTALHGVRTGKRNIELNSLIVGGGAIGYFAALYLRSIGINVNIFDTNSQSVAVRFFESCRKSEAYDLILWTAPNTKGFSNHIGRIDLCGAIGFIGEINDIPNIDILRERDVVVSFGKSSGIDRADLRRQIKPSKEYISNTRSVSENIQLAIELLGEYQEEILQVIHLSPYNKVTVSNFQQSGNLQVIDWRQ
jgi:D-arabinose 1-dehydrogenase-like Zn-dependent alcohol dehydrogenase